MSGPSRKTREENMKLLSLLSACIAVAFCTPAAPMASVTAFAQEAATASLSPVPAASSLTVDISIAVIAMIAVAIMVALFVLVVRSDRNRAGPIEPEEALYHDPWRIPDRC